MAQQFLRSVADGHAACKVCAGRAELFGVVDFHKNCEVLRKKDVLGLSGIPIYYYRCPACDFVFATAFDGFSREDFAKHIYNEQYGLVDPDYLELRPRGNAGMIGKMFGQSKGMRVLDYGGGNGTTAAFLREQGFAQVAVYDPFVPQFAERPAGKFDLIISFEVLEHSPTPVETFADMLSFLERPGIVVYSTLLRTAGVAAEGVNWWYVGPRNGHVSIFSQASMKRMAARCGVQYGSFSQGLHAAFMEVPGFARHLIKGGR